MTVASVRQLMVFPTDTGTEEALKETFGDPAQARKRKAGLARTASKAVAHSFMQRSQHMGTHFRCDFVQRPEAPQEVARSGDPQADFGGAFDEEGEEDVPPALALEGDPTIDVDEEERDRTLNDLENLLALCQEKHLQFDTLRRAKHSTMMLLHYLNPARNRHMPRGAGGARRLTNLSSGRALTN